MRVILVGRAIDRVRLRSELAGAAIDVIGEAQTFADARALGLDADAYVLASNDRGKHRREPDPLTPREIQVLELLAEGLANKAIAARLAISDQTVKFHVSAICGKLGAANRTEAVRLAIRRGLIVL
jgi:DNA-binding NarL/FixJ family response regulator